MSDFPHDEWLRIWQDIQGNDKIGITESELEDAWGLGRDATRRRRRKLVQAGKLKCTIAERTWSNGIRGRTTVYVIAGADEAKK